MNMIFKAIADAIALFMMYSIKFAIALDRGNYSRSN